MYFFLGDDNDHQMQQTTLARLLSELRIPAEVRVRTCLTFGTGVSCEQPIVHLYSVIYVSYVYIHLAHCAVVFLVTWQTKSILCFPSLHCVLDDSYDI